MFHWKERPSQFCLGAVSMSFQSYGRTACILPGCHTHLVDGLLSLQPFFRGTWPQWSFLSDIQSHLSTLWYQTSLCYSLVKPSYIENVIQVSPAVYLLTMMTGMLLLLWVRRTLRERGKTLALKKLLFQIHSIYLVAESLLLSFGFGSLTKYPKKKWLLTRDLLKTNYESCGERFPILRRHHWDRSRCSITLSL